VARQAPNSEIGSQDAKALARVVKVGEACAVGTHCARTVEGGEQPAEDLLGRLYTTTGFKLGSISWGSLQLSLHRRVADRADDA